MGANAKQEDSNLLSAEAYTGQCPVQCEMCYVNFGKSGRATPNIIAKGKSPEARIARKRAMKKGWDGKADVIWRDPDPDWDVRGPSMLRLKTGYIIPAILRVSTLTDSSIPKVEWCQRIVDLWGDHCFFNSTIRILKTRNRNIREAFHKVVVTANGGFQRPHTTPPLPKWVKGVGPKKDQWPRTIEFAHVYAKAAMGTMTPPNSKKAFASFNSPKTLSQISLRDQESKVKFYRLRILPTVEPRLETDAPVVNTMIRFPSVSDACEFAIKYKLNFKYEGSDAHHRAIVNYFGLDEQRVVGRPNRILIGTNAKWNNSQYTGEMSEFLSIGSYWRMSGPHQVEHLPFVCDARKLGCKACGLCATLDGTEPGNVSPIMEPYGLVPIPYSRTYVEKAKFLKNPIGDDVGGSISEDFFGDILEEVFIRKNPGAGVRTLEKDQGWIADALRGLAAYVVKIEYFVEGWNTHEDTLNLTGYCFWALLRKARRAGLGPLESWEWCRSFCIEAAGVDLFEPWPEFMLAWDEQGWLFETFGTVD